MADETTVRVDTRGELIGRLKSKLKQFALDVKAANDARDAAFKERDDARSEAQKAKLQYDENKLLGENETLKTQLRETKHRTVVDRLLAEAGLNPKAKDTFYKVADLKFDADEPDESAHKTLIEKVKADHGYLFGEGEPPKSNGTPGPGRGQGPPATGGRMQATRAQLRDPIWCAEHHAERTAHLKAGTFDLLD